MASASLFSALPAFPEDIPVAAMSRISLANLVAGSTTEAGAVLDTCNRLGFFLLDLNDHPVWRDMIEEVDAIFEIVQKTMQLDTDEKTKYNQDPPWDFLRYKAQGILKTEFFNISQDDLLGSFAPRAVPETISSERARF